MAGDTRVQDEMRQAILRGDFAPRQRLVEAELCDQFNGGRFAIRSALQALEAEGLIERQPNVGARIREVRLEEAVEISQIRMVVEGLVARLAASQVDATQIRHLKDIGKRMRSAVQAGEPTIYSNLNAELHQSLRDIAHHETANRIIAQLHAQLVRHQFALSRVPGRSSVSLVQHLDIIKAVTARDPDGAEAAMRAHIESVIEALQGMAGAG
ncbi:DNA-binding GntR family transcriptional regulator [Branchiibius hedensis]|uniref:DNA-binding transcriptional regulator, GntR family n=1 Tax=Branchiibius hedensis TaxID=672460 RepID=A0A2Y9BUG1_9MICO|nr:GntR family transcriptional regulator [Branchiibius hedensis]PWJ26841.1 DNA-binding GntR family transcriptional regulator [Branchiibius hedensis]SSA35652.1 DNA-binding transcriptional regulator, GntR family [Branchiibius hedensis]